jgi:hypothetical protein
VREVYTIIIVEAIMNREQKGRLATLKVEARAAEKGFIVSCPTTPVRYDLVIDNGTKLSRVQVKYAGGSSQNAEGVAVANLRRRIKGKVRGYNADEIDALMVYIPETDKVYCILSSNFVGKTDIHLRIRESKNGQTKGCLMAKDFEW